MWFQPRPDDISEAAAHHETMTTTLRRPAPAASARPAPTVPPMSRRGDMLTALAATWLVGGVLADGWAHQHETLESVITPWHAILYTGFLAVSAWVGWNGWRHHRSGTPWQASFPAGYGLGAVGAVVFWLSGFADLCWHQAFGIEKGDAALLSPSHLGLLAGGVLLLTAPVRSAVARPRTESDRMPLEAVWALTLATFTAAFLLHELNPFWQNPISIGHRDALAAATVPGASLPVQTGLAATVGAVIVTTLVLFGPLIAVSARWSLTVGRVTLALGIPPIALQAIRGFDDAGLAVLGVLGAVAAALVVRLARVGPGRTWPTRLGLAGGATTFWAVYVGLVAAADHGLGVKAEIWGGLLTWAGLSVLAVACIATVSATPCDGRSPA